MLDDLLHGILSEYHGKFDLRQVPIKVDHIRPMMESRGFVDRIVWEKYDFPVNNIAAQITFYEGSLGLYVGDGDYARIQYSQELNFCWERFVLCKEMCHCALDENPDTRVTNIEQLMKLAEYLSHDTISNLETFEPHETEELAEIMAIELLFPLELRQHHKEAYENGAINDYQLALRYRIPQMYARLAMYPNYTTVITKIRGSKLVSIAD